MRELPPPLAALGAFPQFITYRLVPGARPGKVDKLPLDWRTGRMPPRGSGGHISPEYRTSFAEAAAAMASGRGDGIGFVFTENDPFWFLDIDNALQADGTWSPLAHELCQRLAGAAVEVSQSGRGLHIIGSGVAPPHGCRNVPLGLEFYTEGRFVALTGAGAAGDAAAAPQQALQGVVAQYFPPGAAKAANGPEEWSTGPVPEWSGPESDEDLLRRATASGDRSAAAAFGGAEGVTFRDLWERNVDALAKRWPSSTGKEFDESSADAALAAHLAFWTGKNCERIRGLMYQSGLYRAKWDDRADYYLPRTILRSCSVSKDVAKGSAAPLPPEVTPAAVKEAKVTLREGTGFLGHDGQLARFRGCVYVQSENRIFTPEGALLNKSQFDASYGGYDFILDAQGQKMTSSAWESLMENRVYQAPFAHALCFRPECPPGGIIEAEGRLLLNTYVPIMTRREKGDPAKFLDFLQRILPDAGDRSILISYLAAILQNPGRKFQWWPVIQGAEGNGKTFLLNAMTHAVGERYTHLVDVHKMAKVGNNFNGWVQGNLFVGIEEIYVAERRDFLEAFKATVTNHRIPVEKKGLDQFTGDNRINGLMLTNHRDGVPVNPDGRRYAVFFTAQQNAEEVAAAGLTAEYFSDLYDWAEGRNAYAAHGPKYGFAVINDYLREFAIPLELNPAGLCTRAPRTTSTGDAIVASRGRAEQEIMEAIDQGRPGFCGGWISSTAVDLLLERMRANVPRAKRRAMLEGLGYVLHPALNDGRASITVQPDSARPRLYIRAGHILANISDPLQACRKYEADQTPGSATEAKAHFGA